jgi:endo-1,4-beta-xylanase
MKRVSRREWINQGLAWAAAGALAADGAFAGTPKRDKKHGRGRIHHHRNFLTAGTSPDSLNGLAYEKGLAFGSCLGMSPGKADTAPSVKTAKPAGKPAAKFKTGFDDPQMRALLVAQCGILVPENELKMYSLRPTPKGFDFSRADLMMGFANQYALAVRGHTLLWNRSRWLPEWVNKLDFGSKPGLAAEKFLREHIKTVCSRYAERIFSYDVVNESIAPATGEMEESPFTKAMGPEVIDFCFHAAREASPKAQLVYNDYMSWSPKDAAHRAGVLKLLERLKKANVPVDALGIQAHIGSNGMGASTGLLGDADVVEWKKFLDAVTGMGLDLVVTEFDVNDKTVTGTVAERDKVAAEYAKAYLDIVLSYPQTRYVMAWGLCDKYSWLQKTSPRTDGLAKRPLPYDDEFQPKPLRKAIVDAIAAAPSRTLLPMNPA